VTTALAERGEPPGDRSRTRHYVEQVDEAMPMFPLGGVLFPGMPLRLRVFEPRYREMVSDCLDGTPEFGVVLIERGSEVGGGDVRSAVGTIARIVEAGSYPDGRWGLLTVGTRRVQVREWLPDEPYPQAVVEDRPHEGEAPSEDVQAAVVAAFRRLLAVAAELGAPVPPATVELSDDPTESVYQMAAGAPLGPADGYAVLATAELAGQWERLGRLMAEQSELFAARVAMSESDEGFDPP
jgi:Lon protease-like protein